MNQPTAGPPRPEIVLAFDEELTAPPERVFPMCTRGDLLATWFCDEATSEPHPDGSLVMRWHRPGASSQPYVARWVEWDPPHRCAFEGGHSGYPGGYAGRVEIAIAPAAAGSRLSVRHRMPDTPDYLPIAERYRGAWPRALARLRSGFEPRRGER